MATTFPRLIVAALALGAAGPTAAQGCVGVPDGTASAGKVNQIPFGGKGPTGAFQNVRYQLRLPAAALPSAAGTVTSLEFAPPAPAQYRFQLLEVRLAHLKGAGLAATFADNLAEPARVLSRTHWTWDLAKADAWTPLPIDRVFLWDGRRDLVVEVITQGSSCASTEIGFRRSDTLECVYALGYDAGQPVGTGYGPILSGLKVRLCLGAGGGILTLIGKGCTGSGGKEPLIAAPSVPTPGSPFAVQATQALPAAGGLLILGTSTTAFGPVTLPWPLSALGAAGCTLYIDLLLGVAAQAGATGAAEARLEVPAGTGLAGAAVHVQWLFLDGGANAAGFTLSAGGSTKVQ